MIKLSRGEGGCSSIGQKNQGERFPVFWQNIYIVDEASSGDLPCNGTLHFHNHLCDLIVGPSFDRCQHPHCPTSSWPCLYLPDYIKVLATIQLMLIRFPSPTANWTTFFFMSAPKFEWAFTPPQINHKSGVKARCKSHPKVTLAFIDPVVVKSGSI